MAYRIERINQLIRQEISDLLLREVKDPRIGKLTSITKVETSKDLKYAKVYVSCIGSEEEKKETLDALTSASMFLHGMLAKRIKLRHIPYLDFRWDFSIEKGAHILEIIDQVSRDEAQD